MGIYTYDLVNAKRDLSDVLSTIVQNEPRFISQFRPGTAATNQKHEWLEDQITARGLTAVSVSDSTVTATEADVAKLKVGTLLTIKNDTALFRVDSVPSTTTFTVSRVAANGSATTAIANGSALNIAGTPMAQGTSNGDGEESYHFTGKDYNFAQIFRKDIVLTGSALAITVYGGVDNQITRQTRIALSELTRDLNRLALFGRRVEPTSLVKGEFGGLYYFATQTGGLAVDASAARFDSFVINDGAQAILGEGGSPSLILCAPGQARVLSNEYKGQLQIVREDKTRGAYVAMIVNEITGSTLTIIADPDMADTEAWVMDNGGFELVPLSGRSISDEDTTPKGFDGIRRTALGELTLVFKNAKQRLCRIHNLQGSAAALAAYRSGTTSKVLITNTDPLPVTGSVTVANTAESPVNVSGAVTGTVTIGNTVESPVNTKEVPA